MTRFTHDTAPTQYAERGGIRFAYRRFGIPERPPLVGIVDITDVCRALIHSSGAFPASDTGRTSHFAQEASRPSR
jgi:hypothetical protein